MAALFLYMQIAGKNILWISLYCSWDLSRDGFRHTIFVVQIFFSSTLLSSYKLLCWHDIVVSAFFGSSSIVFSICGCTGYVSKYSGSFFSVFNIRYVVVASDNTRMSPWYTTINHHKKIVDSTSTRRSLSLETLILFVF